MSKARIKVLSLVLAVSMSTTLIMGKSKVVLANENIISSSDMKKDLLESLQSKVTDGDHFSGVEGVEVNKENLPLEVKGNPEEIIRVIVELNDKPATLKMPDGVQPSENAIEEVKEAQQPIQDEVEQLTGEAVRHTYGDLINGFSIEVKRKDIEKIENVSGVKSVNEVNVYYPDMTTAKELTQALEVWQNYGYRGEGLVVSVIDTGIDVTHKDMKISDSSKAKLNEENTKKGQGKFYTDKVPYGYNFADENDEILDIGGSMHGMHVAGIVAANASDEEVKNGQGIQGVAPEAQVLAMKVFSNNQEVSGAYSDDIIAAIEASVQVGADVINMSLGSTAAFRNSQDPEQKAIKNATDDGVVCVVSAGNSATSTDPYIINGISDIGLVGAPGLAADALQVASYENSITSLPALTISINGEDTLAGYTKCDIDPLSVFGQSKKLEVVDCGLGQVSDFKEKDLSGKIALVERGTITFVEKQLNAQAAGASAVIIYNNTTGYINMATDATMKIPALFISMDEGIKVKDNIKNGVTISFKGKNIQVANPSAQKMSSFSSWGPTPSLEFAPQITAPGGNIYSTLNDNKYGSMSGTSMSSPHVAGATALIIQGLKESGIKLQGRELVEFVKNSIINTAKTLEEKTILGETLPYSPRRQGSGMIQAKDAINNRVLALGEDGQATISLKEIGDATNFSITLKNYSDKEEGYSVETIGDVLTAFDLDMVGYEKGQAVSAMAFDTVAEGASLSFDKNKVVVPANGEITINATLSIPTDSVTNNFVEGFVKFVAEDTNTPSLVVPYMGYYGDYDAESIIDAPAWESKSVLVSPSFVVSKILGSYNYLGFEGKDSNGVVINPDKIAISPNDDDEADSFIPALYALRNAKEIKVDLLDCNKEVIAENVNLENEVRKKVLNSTDGKSANVYSKLAWDGTVYNEKTGNNEVVKEGQYYLNYKARVDLEGSEYQNFIIPVKVDTTAVKVDLLSSNKTSDVNYELKLGLNGDGVAGTLINKAIYLNGEKVSDDDIKVLEDNLSANLKLVDGKANIIEIATLDNAYNTGYEKFVVEAGAVDATVKLTNFQEGGYVDNNKLVINGVYSGPVEEILINGEAPDTMANGEFSKAVTLAEGHNTISLFAKDRDGNVIVNNGHKVFCDTTAPELNIISPISNKDGIVKTAKDVIVIKGNVSDNGEGYNLFLNGGNKLNISAEGGTQEDNYRDFQYEVPVKDGDIITLKAVDLVGHETVKQFKVTIDTEAPTFDVNGVENGKVYNTNVNPIIKTLSDDDKLTLTLNGESYNGGEITEEGSYKLVAYAIGSNGLENTISINFTIDKTAPNISVSNITEGGYYNYDLLPAIEIEEGAKVEATLNGAVYNGEVITEEGNYTLLLKVVDLAGNINEKSVNFVIDKTLPAIAINGIVNGMKYDKDIKPEIVVEDGCQYTVTLNNNVYDGAIIKENGEYVLKVFATDKAGNVNEVVYDFSIKLPISSGTNPTPTPNPSGPQEGIGGGITNDSNNDKISSTNKLETINKGKGSTIPNTGGTNSFVVVIIALIFVGAGVGLFLNKRKNTKKKSE